MNKFLKYYRNKSIMFKLFIACILFFLVLPNIAFPILRRTLYALPEDNGFSLEGRTVLYPNDDKTKLMLDTYNYEGKVNNYTTKELINLPNKSEFGVIANYATLPGNNYVFITLATTSEYLWKVTPNKQLAQLQKIDLIDLDEWNKAYGRGELSLSEDMNNKSIYANNHYLTVDNKNNWFGFYDNMINKVDTEKVTEVSERLRMFDLNGVERERQIINIGDTGAKHYKVYLSYLQYPNNTYKLNPSDFGLSTNIKPFSVNPDGQYFKSIEFNINDNFYRAYKIQRYYMGHETSCDFSTLFVVPDIRICHMWQEDALYLDLVKNKSTTTKAIAKTGTIVYFSNGPKERNEYELKNVSYDKELVSFVYKRNTIESKYYVYDLKTNKIAEIVHDGYIY